MINIKTNTLDTKTFVYIYESVGWDSPNVNQVDRALNNTLASFVAYDDDKPIGMIRLLGDDSMCYLIKNLAVIPEYQHNKEGISVGSLLIREAEKYIQDKLQDGEEADVELISTLEGKNFYLRMGYEQRPCDFFGPGMYKCIKK